MAEIKEVDFRGGRAQWLRRIMGRCLRVLLASSGNDLAGFALIAWDNRGNCACAYYADTGPIGRSLLPLYVHDALNRHISVDLAKEAQIGTVTGEK